MITSYLGPTVPRGVDVGATVNALRVRLETNQLADKDHNSLCWQVREALRTEFFKIKFPAPPSPPLLHLVTTTEVLLTNFATVPRPYYFPGGRVTVPIEGGKRRCGTTLQLRFKGAGEEGTEALVHLDGEKGGAFRWVHVRSLAPSSARPATGASAAAAVAALPYSTPPGAVPTPPGAVPVAHMTPVALAAATANAAAVAAAAAAAQAQAFMRQRQKEVQVLQANRLVKAAAQKKEVARVQARMMAKAKKDREEAAAERERLMTPVDALPLTFVPDCLRVVPEKPRKRLRRGISGPVSIVAGAVEAAGGVTKGDVEEKKDDEERVSTAVQTSPLVVVPMASPESSPTVLKVRISPESLTTVLPASTGGSETSGLAKSRSLDLGVNLSATQQQPGLSSSEQKQKQKQRSVAAVTEKILVIERLVARRKNMTAGGVVEFFVKWRDADWECCSWESRDALVQDVPGLVERFEMQHPGEPAEAVDCGDREPPAAERAARDVLAVAKVAKERGAEEEGTKDGDILVPTWYASPIADLSFAGGMVMHIRPGEETVVFNDTLAAGRDMKRRLVKFRKEYPEKAARLCPLAKFEVDAKERNEANAMIVANAKAHKEAGSRMVQLPRALGSALPVDVPRPVSRADIQAAPPSWESYLQSLGLECVNWERSQEPLMPTVPLGAASEAVSSSARHALHAEAAVLRVQEKERFERMIQERTDVDKSLRTKKRIRRADCTKSSSSPRTVAEGMYDEDVEMYNNGSILICKAGAKLSVEKPSSTGGEGSKHSVPTAAKCSGSRRDGLLRDKSKLFARALEVAKSSSLEREREMSDIDNLVYDPFFCCWRKAKD